MAMGSNGRRSRLSHSRTAPMAVVRTDPHEPRILEVVAIFHDAHDARYYADIENDQSARSCPRSHLKQHRKKRPSSGLK